MAIRLAINGFGRVGRAVLRAAHERELPVEWAAINDVAGPETLAYLLKHDTVYGPFTGSVDVGHDAIVVDGMTIPVVAETDPIRLPWDELGVDVVVESTGRFRTRRDAAM